jgi:hypothetical protein
MRNLDTTGVNSYTVEWSMRRIGGESVLIPVLDTESMQVILSVFRGQAVVGQTSSNDGTNSQDAGAAGPFVSIERTAAISTTQLATFLLEQMMNNDDSTSTTIPVVSPKQQRLGVFPPDDPTCR